MSKGNAGWERFDLEFPAAGKFLIHGKRDMLLRQVNANTDVHAGPPIAKIGIQHGQWSVTSMTVQDSMIWKPEQVYAGKPTIEVRAEEPGTVTVGVAWVDL